MNADIDAKAYCAIEPDKRYGLDRYNFELLPAMPADIFSDDELKILEDATTEYRRRISDIPGAIQKKELERLIIELADNCAPLSYRSVDENEYREAMLTFYELNSISPFKKIFISQYDFAARNYAVK